MYTVTTDEAINRGRKILFRGPALVFFGCVGACALAMFLLKNGNKWIPVWGFSTMAVAIAAPMVVYMRLLPGWRIWALSNVQNVHEFKRTAMLRQIYPEDNSFWWRFELATQEQKEKLHGLADRFNEPDVFEDDQNIPHETAYSYSKKEIAGFVLCSALFLGLGLVLPAEKKYALLAIMVACSAFFAYQAYKRLSADGPQLTVSDEGITTAKHGFHSWREVSNEQVVWVKAGESSHFKLSYTANYALVEMSLRELMGKKGYKLDHILRVYRGRYEAGRRAR